MTPGRSPASETIVEHPQRYRSRNGVGASPDFSGLAGADVSLRADDGPPPASAGDVDGSLGSVGVLAGASSFFLRRALALK